MSKDRRNAVGMEAIMAMLEPAHELCALGIRYFKPAKVANCKKADMKSKPVIRLREEILSFSHARESVRAEIRRAMQFWKFPLEAIGSFERAASLQPGIPIEEARQFFEIEFIK